MKRIEYERALAAIFMLSNRAATVRLWVDAVCPAKMKFSCPKCKGKPTPDTSLPCGFCMGDRYLVARSSIDRMHLRDVRRSKPRTMGGAR